MIEFYEADMIEKPEQIDATISFALPPEHVIAAYHAGKYATILPHEMWFRLEDDLLIYVANGCDVRVWKINSDLDDTLLHTYILSGAITFLLFQHEYIIIHGSALFHQGNAFIISGPSGSGKSTTALEMLQRCNISFASDDLCAVKYENGKVILYPGPPWQKVCPDVKEQKEDIFKNARYLKEMKGKYGRKLTCNYETTPLPVSRLFVISRDTECKEVKLEKLKGEASLQCLTHNLFRGEMFHMLGITPTLTFRLIQIANALCIYEIIRPTNQNTVRIVCDLIETEIE